MVCLITIYALTRLTRPFAACKVGLQDSASIENAPWITRIFLERARRQEEHQKIRVSLRAPSQVRHDAGPFMAYKIANLRRDVKREFAWSHRSGDFVSHPRASCSFLFYFTSRPSLAIQKNRSTMIQICASGTAKP